MEHPNLTATEKKIVSDFCAKLGQRMMAERLDPSRWPDIVLALVGELARQAVRLVDEEITLPGVPPRHDSEPPFEAAR